MVLLGLVEQFLDVPGRHPVAQHLHEATDVGPTVSRLLVLGVEEILRGRPVSISQTSWLSKLGVGVTMIVPPLAGITT